MTWSHPAYQRILKWLEARTGLYFSERRCAEAEQGVRRAMARTGATDLDQFAASVARDGGVIDELIAELSVTESYFFREPRQFGVIRNEVLPEIAQRLGDLHQIRAWSAGCAAGEEPYSLAIVFAQAGLADRSHILATDISRSALEKAKSGVYEAWSVSSDARQMAEGFLQERDGGYEVDEQIRQLVSFEYQNLVLDLYPCCAAESGRMDLILCRNVLIYFEPAVIPVVAQRLFDSLAPGGWLITASTDPWLSALAPFETVKTRAGIVYRRPLASPAVLCVGAGEKARPLESPHVLREVVPAGAAPPLAAQRRGPALAADRRRPAQLAYEAGDYRRAAELAAADAEDSRGCELRVRALANIDPSAAEQACAAALARHRLSVPLHYLHAVLLVGQGRDDESLDQLNQVTYLDRSQPLAHYTRGSILQRRGDLRGAMRAYRNAQRLCEALAPDACVPLSDGERADRLRDAVAQRIAALRAIQENEP